MKFSIVIPTRNRAAKLRYALMSALHQSFDDYEIVVSNNNSKDDTEAVVNRQRHPRLRYFKTPESLSMVDHWEFALGKAQGEWVLFLCDDDALLPHALAQLDSVARQQPGLRIVQYGSVTYMYDDGIVANGAYVEVGEQLRTNTRLVDSHERLVENYQRLSGTMPKFLNSAVHQSLIEKIRFRYGRMFLNWAPDYSAGILLLAHSSHFAKVGPLMLWGANMESYGAGSQRSPATMSEFFHQFPAFTGRLDHSPYPDLLTVANAVYDTFARRETLGPEFDELRTNEARFRRLLLKDVKMYVDCGHPEYNSVAAVIKRDLVKLRASYLLRPLVAHRAVLEGVQSLTRRTKRNIEARVVARPGLHRKHFPNIFEAACYVSDLARARDGEPLRRAA